MTRMSRVVLLLVVLPLACRDAPALFEAPDLPPLGPAPYQLTFSPDGDVSPAWSVDGDTVFYFTELATVHPNTPSDTIRLMRAARKIPAGGGTAEVVLPFLQPDRSSTSVERISVSSTGTIAAFIRLPLHGSICGPETPVTCEGDVGPSPLLDGAVVRVGVAAERTLRQAELLIAFPGRQFDSTDPPAGVTGVHVTELFPFQRAFNETGRFPSLISWSPEGDRLVVSDGVGLLVWTPETGDTFRIPGSEDGINPAWSPTGDWIAFERFERGAATQADCVYGLGDNVQCVERRTKWTVPGRSMAIVRPEGGSLQLLPEGTHPAWSHDGTFVYYESSNAIWRVALDGENPVRIPDTANSFEPALSADGLRLAVTRGDPASGRTNVWIVSAVP